MFCCKYCSLISLFLLSLLIVGCGGEPSNCDLLANRVGQLEKQISNDSQMVADFDRQILEIDQAIDSVARFTDEANQGKVNKRDFKTRIKAIENTIAEKTKEIAILQEDLKKSKNGGANKRFLRSLEDKKKLISQQLEEILQLKEKIGRLEEENESLQTNNDNLQGEIASKDLTIVQISDDITAAQEQLAALYKEIEKQEANAKKLKKQTTNQYVTSALELIKIAENTKGVLKAAKNTRESCSKKAFEYLCKAHKNGDYNALTELDRLKSHSKLGKLVRGMSCN